MECITVPSLNRLGRPFQSLGDAAAKAQAPLHFSLDIGMMKEGRADGTKDEKVVRTFIKCC